MGNCLGCDASLAHGQYCGSCRSLYHQQYREAHREKANSYSKAYQATHKEKVAAYDKERRQKKLKEIREKEKNYYYEHREERLTKSRIYQRAHKEERAAYDKEYRAKNKEKLSARSKLYHQLNPDRHLSAKLKRFGMTLEDYRELHEKQNGVCAICHQAESSRHASGKIKSLAIDHDHSTGKVRGLLCARCNTGIGQLGDSSDIVARSLRYLETLSVISPTENKKGN